LRSGCVASGLRFGAQSTLEPGALGEQLVAAFGCRRGLRSSLQVVVLRRGLVGQAQQFSAARCDRRVSGVRVPMRALMVLERVPRALSGVECILH